MKNAFQMKNQRSSMFQFEENLMEFLLGIFKLG
jgi:hypothetical protein